MSEERFVWKGREVALFDLSDTLDNATASLEPNAHEISYIGHVASRDSAVERMAEGLDIAEEATRSLFSRGHAWAVEEVRLSSHAGTHVDAPYHYGPETPRGDKSLTVDELPLRWCFGDGVLLDMTHKDRVEGISKTDVEAELERIGYALKPFDIVLIRTGTSDYFGEPGYDRRHAGLRRDATAYLVSQGVKMIGIDAWGLDRAFDVLAAEVLRHEAGVEFWESHLHGIEAEYAQIEKLANLDKLPVTHGFTVMAFPFKLKSGSAGWSRVVALVDTKPSIYDCPTT